MIRLRRSCGAGDDCVYSQSAVVVGRQDTPRNHPGNSAWISSRIVHNRMVQQNCEPLIPVFSRCILTILAGILTGPIGLRHFRDDLLQRLRFGDPFHAETLEIRR